MVIALHRRWTSALPAAMALLAMGVLSGCSQILTSAMVEAPNKGRTIDPKDDWGPGMLGMFGIDEQFRVSVGPPKASLLVWVVEPRDDAMLVDGQPRGTIMVLHGYAAEMFWFLDVAKHFADRGYRAVLVDLRGNGGSSGDWMTYGVVEKHDLSQVIDALETRGLVAGRLGVWGNSYGAATAIQLAGVDKRVRAVVAVAPFSSLREVAPNFAHGILPGVGWLISRDAMEDAVTKGGRLAGFNPDEADAISAIKATDAPVLLMHGTWDQLVPVEHSERLHAAAPGHSELVVLEGLGHIAAYFDPFGDVARLGPAWFDRWLRAAPQ